MKTKQQPTEYDLQAEKFCKSVKLNITTEYIEHRDYFDDKQRRAVYEVTFHKGSIRYRFEFGQSINDSYLIVDNRGKKAVSLGQQHTNMLNLNEAMKEIKDKDVLIKGQHGNYYLRLDTDNNPTKYEILACIEKYDPETFQDFCDNYGYSNDSIQAEKTYFKVKEQYNSVKDMFTEKELEQLAEIQ